MYPFIFLPLDVRPSTSAPSDNDPTHNTFRNAGRKDNTSLKHPNSRVTTNHIVGAAQPSFDAERQNEMRRYVNSPQSADRHHDVNTSRPVNQRQPELRYDDHDTTVRHEGDAPNINNSNYNDIPTDHVEKTLKDIGQEYYDETERRYDKPVNSSDVMYDLRSEMRRRASTENYQSEFELSKLEKQLSVLNSKKNNAENK